MINNIGEIILSKNIKLSKIESNDILSRRLFLHLDGKTKLSEITGKLGINDSDALEIIKDFLSNNYVSIVHPPDFDLSVLDISTKSPDDSGFQINQNLDESLNIILKKYLGPLSVPAVKKDLLSAINKKVLGEKLMSYTNYISDENDKENYLKEINKYLQGE